MTTTYGIIGVKFKKEKRHIEAVRICEIAGYWPQNPQIRSREDIVSALERKIPIFTYISQAGQWKKGDEVNIVLFNNIKFIRTDGNNTEEDNLGALPEF